MGEHRATRGVTLPSAGQILVIAAALVAVWLFWSQYGRISNDSGDSQTGGSPVKGLNAVESSLSERADALPEFLASLDSADPEERSQAAYGLGRIGPPAADALEKLRERLADADPRVRENAAYAVANIDPDKEAAAAAIAPLVADARQSVRESVEKELLEIGSPACQPLLAMLHRDEAQVRLAVVRIFRNTGTSAYSRKWVDQRAEMSQAVRRLVEDSDSGVRIEALTLLAEWQLATLAEVGELLRSDESRRVGVALNAVSQMKEEAAELLPDIVVLLDRGPPGGILHTLKSMKAAARAAAPRLVKLSETSTSSEQLEIARTLAEIDADPEDIARILGELLLLEGDSGRHIDWRAGELLLKVNPAAARRQVSRLIQILLNDAGTVDKTVLFALHTLGPEAGEAVPKLIPLLKNSDPWVVEFAAHALNRAGLAGVTAASDLANVVSNASRPYAQRIACANALASLGRGANGTVPLLLKMVTSSEPQGPVKPAASWDNDWALRAAIVTALGQIDGDEAGLVPALRTQLKSPSHDVRAAAADALGRVAGQSAEVLAELVPLLHADMPIVRAQAALAIGRSTVDRQRAVATLSNLLSDENPHVRLAAAVALGKIGPAAREALPMLHERLTVPLGSGRNDASQFLNIPDLHRLSFDQAARTAIAAVEGETEKEAQ